ncbi:MULTISPECIES: sugar transferase [Cryobacterium]|uniref:sugar transferase n=1 Tax=Cryobacterium TaxID=69578 RepID=UPI000B4C980C|nr:MULTISPECIES: sugar transferase [Cryobacterium]ASD23318.1 polyprenyl glycosylphosphotransferase [Cryobacterium sp. LW097]POH64940.1 sugar transferase [Cryobacterium zongtaii]TFC43095.1 sugar transferase [Cryobacterium sp. TMN-39-2]TFC56657.1 sugar transferase [Cryobacterium sp. TMB3-1-2]TFC63286.1 sugar transferase [Cryobacterium sp. TMB1-7]
MSAPKPGSPLTEAIPRGYRAPLRLVRPATVPVPDVQDTATAAAASGLSGAAWARQYRTKLQLTDAAVIVAAVTAAFLARFALGTPIANTTPIPLSAWAVIGLVIGTWIVTLSTFRTRAPRVVAVGATEYKLVINASALAFGLLAIAFLLLQVNTARAYFVFALPLGVAALVLERWLWRKWLIHQRKFGHYLARAIVVGGRDDIEYVVRQINDKSGAAYHVVGAALEDENTTSVTSAGHRVPVVSDFAHVAAAAQSLGVDAVIVAGHPSLGNTFIRNLGWDLEKTSAELVLSSRLTDVAGPRIHFRPVEGLPLIHVEIPQYDGAKHVLKRALDITLGATALLVISPLLLVIGVLVKLDSPGPVLFRQERVGRNGRTFHMIKIRSMVRTAEDDLAGLLDKNEGAGVLFKIRSDPRITRVGRVLRKYSLDELPQLWNIVVGQMSLVGPRPPLPAEVENYESHMHRRLYIKPGLTGMWQVNGRSNLSWEESVRLDLYYVENWSLAGDLMIIWRTVKIVIRPLGAY